MFLNFDTTVFVCFFNSKKCFFVVILLLISACRERTKIETYEEWGFKNPSGFPEPTFKFENNTQTFDRFQLGRDLFYDPFLSIDSTISCASCHEQVHSFAGHGSAFSLGINGLEGNRNSPGLANMAWNKSFLWDGGVNHLEIFPLAPITNPVEMGETIEGVITKLNKSASYRKKFKVAFGNDEITDQHFLQALAQFMAMIISDQSKYDKVRRGEESFTEIEALGYSLFKKNCTSCHTEPLLTNYEFINNGLDSTWSDLGRGEITQEPKDFGKFKVPSLRNVLNTYPYMHDGRFYTIDAVLNHYTSGIKHSATLDKRLINKIVLSSAEREYLKAFLATLTDYSLLTNKLLSEPKK